MFLKKLTKRQRKFSALTCYFSQFSQVNPYIAYSLGTIKYIFIEPDLNTKRLELTKTSYFDTDNAYIFLNVI